MAKEMKGARFVNMSLTFDVELYFPEAEVPAIDFVGWMAERTRKEHCRFAIGYNVDRQAFNGSITMPSSDKDDDANVCVSLWGKSVESVLTKLFVVFEEFNGFTDLTMAKVAIEGYEDKLKDALTSSLKKKK